MARNDGKMREERRGPASGKGWLAAVGGMERRRGMLGEAKVFSFMLAVGWLKALPAFLVSAHEACCARASAAGREDAPARH